MGAGGCGVTAFLSAARIEAGINFFDTADIYSLGVSEEITGRALKEFGPSRDKLVIATKVFNAMGDDPNQQGLSRKHIMHAIDDSLRRLQTDYVDLYQIHRFDPHTPIEETLEALDQVVRSGQSALYRCVVHVRLAVPENAPDLRRDGAGPLRHHAEPLQPGLSGRRTGDDSALPGGGDRAHPVEPLARGFLAGNRNTENRGETIRAKTDDFAQKLYYRPSDFTVVDRLTEIANKRGVQNSQVALAWILSKPGVSAPIIGASKMTHLDQAIDALKIHLDESEIKALEEPYEPHPVLGF